MESAKISLEEAERFEFACKEYAQRIEEMVVFLRSCVDRVGGQWHDDDYETVCGMVADIERETVAALRVANEDIIPYVSKKVDLLKSK